MNWLLPLTLGVLLVVGGCSSATAADDDTNLTNAEKAEHRKELRDTYVGTWNGELVPESGDRPTFVLRIEVVAADTKPQCGTVELGAGVGTTCISIYESNARATLTTSDGRFTNQVFDGTISNIEARFDLPSAGFVSIGQGGGRFSYGEGQLSGTIQASRQ